MANDEHLTGYLDELHSGDQQAINALIQRATERLARLTAKMLKGFPGVRRWEDSDDVLQNALVRLTRALQTIRPKSTREFLGLATEQIRRELIDLARHYSGVHGIGRNLESGLHLGDAAANGFDPAADTPTGNDLDKWATFHMAVEQLPALEREVFGLTFYHKWSQQQIAELFHMDERTVRRRWQSAAKLLNELLAGELPEG